jgi:hypothetical protein
MPRVGRKAGYPRFVVLTVAEDNGKIAACTA